MHIYISKFLLKINLLRSDLSPHYATNCDYIAFSDLLHSSNIKPHLSVLITLDTTKHVGFKHWIKIKSFSTQKPMANFHHSRWIIHYTRRIQLQNKYPLHHNCISSPRSSCHSESVCMFHFIYNKAQDWLKSFNHTCAITYFVFI